MKHGSLFNENNKRKIKEKSKCIKCNEKTTIRLSPDIDVQGDPVCEKCKTEVQTDLLITIMEDSKYFERKYFNDGEK